MFRYALLLLVTFALSAFTVFAQEPSSPNPKALEALTKGDFPGAIRLLDNDIAEGKNLFQSYRFRSDVRRMVGDFRGALADVNKAIELRPTEGRLYETRAQLRMFTGADPKETANDLDMAISNGVKHENVYEMRGMIRMHSGDYDSAIADYQTAINMRPNFAKAHIGLSSAYKFKEDDAKAMEVLENFLAGVENSTKKIGAVRGELAAIATVDIPQQVGKNVKVGQDTVIYKQETNDPGPMTPEAAQRMGARLEQSKNTALAYINLAQLYEKQGQFLRAMETVEKGLAMDRSDYFGIGIRGVIKIGLKDYSGALADLDAAIRVIQRSADFYGRRGIAYLMLGREAEAEADFAKFLELAPKGKDRLEKLKNAALAEKASQ
jgi:tetratricopeptide (TPR) repeat protein